MTTVCVVSDRSASVTADTGLLARLQPLIATDRRSAPAVARIALGVILLPHGAQHALGWFGGGGFAGTLEWMNGTLGLPAPLAALGIALELVAPIALIVGIGGRLAALSMALFMAVAMSTHLASGFFMNWFGTLPAGSEGFEFHLLAIALAIVVTIDGSGRLSIDAALTRSR